SEVRSNTASICAPMSKPGSSTSMPNTRALLRYRRARVGPHQPLTHNSTNSTMPQWEWEELAAMLNKVRRSLRCSLAFGLATSILALPGLAAQDAKALKALDEAKAAMGGASWNAVHFVHTKVQIATSGLKGTSEGWNDAQLGYYAEHYVLGPVTGADGYDG